jgi:hypothetical protein
MAFRSAEVVARRDGRPVQGTPLVAWCQHRGRSMVDGSCSCSCSSVHLFICSRPRAAQQIKNPYRKTSCVGRDDKERRPPRGEFGVETARGTTKIHLQLPTQHQIRSSHQTISYRRYRPDGRRYAMAADIHVESRCVEFNFFCSFVFLFLFGFYTHMHCHRLVPPHPQRQDGCKVPLHQPFISLTASHSSTNVSRYVAPCAAPILATFWGTRPVGIASRGLRTKARDNRVMRTPGRRQTWSSIHDWRWLRR